MGDHLRRFVRKYAKKWFKSIIKCIFIEKSCGKIWWIQKKVVILQRH